MPKTRVQKEALLASLADRLGRSQTVVFIGAQGITVDQFESMRDAFFKEGLQLQVAKNTLLKRVLADFRYEVPAEVLDQPLALVYSYADPVAGPKTLQPFKKEIETLQVLGGLNAGQFITPAQVEALAKLPSREQLLAQLVGTLNAPISGLVNVMAGNLRSLVTVLNAIKDAKPA